MRRRRRERGALALALQAAVSEAGIESSSARVMRAEVGVLSCGKSANGGSGE